MSHCLLRRTHALRHLLLSRPVAVDTTNRRRFSVCPSYQEQAKKQATHSAREESAAGSSSAAPDADKLVRILCEGASGSHTLFEEPSSTPNRQSSGSEPTLTHPSFKPTRTPPDPILSAYNTLRALDISRFASLPKRHILRVINRAVVFQSTKAISNICEDLPSVAASQNRRDFYNIAHALILSAAPAQLITPTQAWHILHDIGDDGLARLPIPAVLALGGLLGRVQPPVNMEIQGAAAMCANTMIANFPIPLQNEDAPGRKYVRVLTQVGNLLVVLGNNNQHKTVYELLTNLFQAERVPRSAIRAVDFSTNDVRAIVVDVVIKASLDWRYLDIAEEVFLQHFPRIPIFGLGLDIISEQIQSGSNADFQRGNKLLVTMFTNQKAGRVSDDLLQKFYEAAMERNKGEVAEEVYAASQQVSKSSPYPPPQGESLNWLVRHMSLHSMNVHLARQITRHVVSSGHRLPLQQRASFIALAAQNGFASEARALWETYAAGDDGKIVTGNAATAIRLVRLYVHLTEVQTAKLNVATEGDNGPDSIRPHEERGGETSRVDPNASVLIMDRASAPHLLHGSEARVDSLRTEQYRRDLEGFCRRVFDLYCEAKQPLRLASHKDLTSLARMAFLLKENKQGFAALTTMLDRKEVPDIYDVNVALSAMAAQSPREAGALLRRMRRHGLQPDGVTFGTVIHHAFLQEDYPLVRWLVSYARWLDGGQISLRAIKSLVDTSLREQGISREARQRNLQRCRSVLAALADVPDVATPSLGLLCVRAALNLGDPRTAFYFWKTYVKTRTDWSNRKERVQRVHMAIQIRQRREQGTLPEKVSRLMLHELREEE